MSAESTVAWRPDVEGIAEVFRAHFEEHAYPMHTHDVWTLLTVDRGRIGYELGGERCDSTTRSVTLLPPHVAHDGHSLTAGGFDKRVIYLESRMLTGVGRAVGRPTLLDGPLRRRVDRLNSALTAPGEEFEAASRLALILERLQWHLDGNPQAPEMPRNRSVAHAFRDLLDGRIREGMTLAEAGRALYVDPTHLVREFSREFGLPPHRYLIGRRVELARGMLLAGGAPAEVSVEAGFHDQSHLNRHFKSMVGTTPGRYARSGGTAARR
ncbi:helix-turn-helix domain-containing protein [Tsukamurella ocularis]|uniref:helix-turn-helix domain-containing protein n=1 Tax=Tsukamurella ocularis TaxID=1970234 RepID=UPI002167463F|nr:AraC family transcriptional regulator [Tsukamurella ocularis]MCS3780148.1 AraC-like DNA-binding protein [Tsukamurella ocularis]MCS3786298.1 AraC-like DNA-binding protein [Tsukamurella ocularis]MCS3849662.1 AraC-like DNA-binding protein [Tsukamurella ocularis]